MELHPQGIVSVVRAFRTLPPGNGQEEADASVGNASPMHAPGPAWLGRVNMPTATPGSSPPLRIEERRRKCPMESMAMARGCQAAFRTAVRRPVPAPGRSSCRDRLGSGGDPLPSRSASGRSGPLQTAAALNAPSRGERQEHVRQAVGGYRCPVDPGSLDNPCRP